MTQKLILTFVFLSLLLAMQAQRSFTMTFDQGKGAWQGPQCDDGTAGGRLSRISSLDILCLKVIHHQDYQANVDVKFPSLGSDEVEQFSFGEKHSIESVSSTIPNRTQGGDLNQESVITIDSLVRMVKWDTLSVNQLRDVLEMLDSEVNMASSSDSSFQSRRLQIQQIEDTLSSWRSRYPQNKGMLEDLSRRLEAKVDSNIKSNDSVGIGGYAESDSTTSTYIIPMSGISQGGLIINLELVNPTENDTITTATWKRAQNDWKGHNAWSVGLTFPRAEFYSIDVDSASFSIGARAMTHSPVIGTGLVFEQKARNMTTGVYLGLNYALDDEDQSGRVSGSAGITLRPTKLPYISFTIGGAISEVRALSPGYRVDEDYEIIDVEDVPVLDDVLVKDYRMSWYVGLVLQNISRGAM